MRSELFAPRIVAQQIRVDLRSSKPPPSALLSVQTVRVLQALINPLPSLGVAWEVRPGLLKAMSSDERVRLAVAAIKASIAHLQGPGGADRD